MKTKIFILLVFASLCVYIHQSSYFNSPAQVEILGYKYIQKSKDAFYVEINSRQYIADKVYTDRTYVYEKKIISPAENMYVTAFRLNGKDKVIFMSGKQSAEYLATYFSSNLVLSIINVIGFVSFIMYIVYRNIIPKKEKVLTD